MLIIIGLGTRLANFVLSCFQWEGASSDDYIVFLIDLVSQGSVLLPYFDSGIPQNYWDPTKRELVYVPGSNTIVASMFGN